MEKQFIEATEMAITKLVAEFQCKAGRYWNERDLHWILYYNLRAVFPENDPLELLRAEFPTIKKYPARGHYDLTILDPISYYSEDVQRLTMDAGWDDYLPKLKVLIAIEMKLWQARLSWEIVDEQVNWDIQKLTDVENKAEHPYFLNFIQLDFRKSIMKEYYIELRKRIMSLCSGRSNIRILYVPNQIEIQSDSDSWLSII